MTAGSGGGLYATALEVVGSYASVTKGSAKPEPPNRFHRFHPRERSTGARPTRSNRSSTRRHGLCRRASDGFDWNAPAKRVRHVELGRLESARA